MLSSLLIAFFVNAYALGFSGKFSASPDNSQSLLTSVVSEAKKEIHLNIYMWTSTRLADLVVEKIRSGVTVKILAETEPFGGQIVPPQKKVLDTLDAAMKASPNKANRLWIMTGQKGLVKRRYNFNHAKYVVIDRRGAYVASENFVNSGAMADPTKKGNRGWHVFMQDQDTAEKLLSYFRQDAEMGSPDVVEYDPKYVSVKELPSPPTQNNEVTQQDKSKDRTLTPFPSGAGDIQKAEFCASPKSRDCIVSFIRSARSNLDIQHMSIPLYWPKEGGEKELNPLVSEALAAAKKGVKVRILINPSYQAEKEDSGRGGANPPPYDAEATLAFLRQQTTKENLPLEVAIMNNEALQLVTTHNKGMLADGKRAFVSSINGTWNSVANNREIAVALDSPAAAQYYGQIFQFDWSQSAKR